MGANLPSSDRFDVEPVVADAIDWTSQKADRLAVVGISPPGAGKTTAALKSLIEDAATTGNGAALLMGSHRLAAEKLEQALLIADRLGVDGRVVHMQGQTALCPHGRGLASAFRKGYGGKERMLHRIACGFDGCAYTAHIDGIGSGHIKIATHAHLPFLLETHRLTDNIVVIDELSALHEDIRLDDRDFWLASGGHAMGYFATWLQPMNKASKTVVNALQALEDVRFASKKSDVLPFVVRKPIRDKLDLLVEASGLGRPALMRELEEAAAVDPAKAPSPPAWALREDDLSRVPRADLPRFFATVLSELRSEAGPDTGSVACFCQEGYGKDARVWVEWRVRKELPPAVSVLLLDATAELTAPLTRAAFKNKDVRLFNHRIKMPGPADGLFAYHVEHRSLTRRRLFTSRGGQPKITVKGAASVRNVFREAIRCARAHLPPAPATAVTAPRPATRALTAEKSILGEFCKLAQAAGDFGELTTAYHFGLRGLNTLEDATLFINLGDPLKNLSALHEEARLFGLDRKSHVALTAAAELIQTLHRSRALRVTPDGPKVIVHAGRNPMIGFDALTIRLGPGPPRSDERRALEDFAELLLEHGGATAPWLAEAVFERVHALSEEAGVVLAGSAALVAVKGIPDSRQRNRWWRELFGRRPDVATFDIPDPRPLTGQRGRPLRLYARSEASAAVVRDDFESWLPTTSESLLPHCCAYQDGTPMAPRGLSDKFPIDLSRGELVQKPTKAALAAFRLIRGLL